jgi:hypothetical protein
MPSTEGPLQPVEVGRHDCLAEKPLSNDLNVLCVNKSTKRQQHEDELSQDLIPVGFAEGIDGSVHNPSPPKRVRQGAADASSYFQEDVGAGFASTKKRTAEKAAVARSGAASSRQQKLRKVSQ